MQKMIISRDHIKELMDQVRGIEASPENQAKARYWQGVACELRGFSDFLVGLLLRPSFAHDLLGSIVEARKEWTCQRDAYLGLTGRTRGTLGNDDVACPTLSPTLYRDMIWPYEQALQDYYGGLFYWHSCGQGSALEFCLDPVDEVQMADEAKIRGTLEEIVDLCGPDTAAFIKVDSLEIMRDLDTEMAAIQRFIRVAPRRPSGR